MCSFKSIYFVIFILNLYKTNAQISDKRLCADPDCKEPVSLARTLLRYSSPDARILSFAPNTNIKIYSKEAGSETNLWGAEIKGKRGYVPKHLVRETKVIKVPKLLVDTELKQKPQVPMEVNKENVKPNKVQELFEVVDGTTIYLNPQDGINPSSTESPILSTTAPEDTSETKDNAEALNSVENSKENDAAEKKNEEDSVVDNVISTFSNWMSDDSNSEELEDIDDEGEDDEDEEEDEEEDSLEENPDFQNQLNETVSEEAEDINSLHNLPPEVKVSPYNLKLDQPPKENVENASVVLTKDISQQNSVPDVSSSVPLPQESNKNGKVPEKKEVNHISEVKEQTVEVKPALNQGLTPSENKEEIKKDSEVKPVLNQDLTPSENKEEIKKDSDHKIISNLASVEAVTEATFTEEEPLPILDDVTPNPLDIKIEEKLEIEESSFEKTDVPQQTSTVVENKNQQLNSVQPAIAVPENETVESFNANVEEQSIVKPEIALKPVPQESPDPVENKPSQSDHNLNPVHKEEDLPTFPSSPPLGLFNKAQNLVPNENTNKEETPIIQSVNVEEPIKEEGVSNKEIGNEGNTVISDVSKEEINNEENDASKQNPNVVNIVSKEDSMNEEEILNDMSREEVASDSKEEIISDILKDVESEILNEDNVNVPNDDDIDLDDVSKEKNEADIGEENISYDDIVIDEKESVNEGNNEEVLNSEGDNLDPFVYESSDTVKEGGGILSGLFSLFGSDTTDDFVPSANPPFSSDEEGSKEIENMWSSENNPDTVNSELGHCHIDTKVCKTSQRVSSKGGLLENFELNFNSDIFLYLITTAISVILFLFGYLALDRNRREAPLVAKINILEKQLLITLKENELLQENGSSAFVQEIESVPNEVVDQLTQRLGEIQLTKQALEARIGELEKEVEEKEALEEQIENLEKELETSTEVGMELNRIISEMLNPTNGSEWLKENVEQLQRQLLEQKDTINTMNESLRDKEAENKTLRVELERNKKKAMELQNKLDELVEKVMKIEKEKDQQQNTLQNEIVVYQQKYSEAVGRADVLSNDIQLLRVQLSEVQRQAEIKTREYQTLKESVDKIKSIRNDSNAMRSLLDATSTKAELQQLKAENEKYTQQLQQEQSLKVVYEKKYQVTVEEINVIKQKYEQADKEKVEVNSKLEVLNNYFKKREAELQEEVIKYKSIWDAKQGEATSTTERIKYMQEEIENYKAQNETLKQEIISQEIELKSQISMLEKKVHENWVMARQTDRKLEDARQEAAQLRHRLTLRERAIHEERAHNRLQSPIEQNGELPLSPHPIDSPASPPLLLYGRDHITKSPPLPGLPPFLPPPPGAPFMPPPLHGMPPFMPPPPSMYPGDHRPPPLGRMSSPPLNSRYSPDNSAFSPYDRNSPSPPYDSEYGASPPPIRGYSPYNSRDDRRDYKRPPHPRTNGRNTKGSRMSSGSEHSNDSLDKINRKQSKMV